PRELPGATSLDGGSPIQRSAASADEGLDHPEAVEDRLAPREGPPESSPSATLPRRRRPIQRAMSPASLALPNAAPPDLDAPETLVPRSEAPDAAGPEVGLTSAFEEPDFRMDEESWRPASRERLEPPKGGVEPANRLAPREGAFPPPEASTPEVRPIELPGAPPRGGSPIQRSTISAGEESSPRETVENRLAPLGGPLEIVEDRLAP